jgi:hypothetical protein
MAPPVRMPAVMLAARHPPRRAVSRGPVLPLRGTGVAGEPLVSGPTATRRHRVGSQPARGMFRRRRDGGR